MDEESVDTPISEALTLLSSRPWVPPNEVHVIVMEDTPGSGLDAKGNPAIMTDGCGLISFNLAETFPQVTALTRSSVPVTVPTPIRVAVGHFRSLADSALVIPKVHAW